MERPELLVEVLKAKYRRVFFVPGNRDLALNASEAFGWGGRGGGGWVGWGLGGVGWGWVGLGWVGAVGGLGGVRLGGAVGGGGWGGEGAGVGGGGGSLCVLRLFPRLPILEVLRMDNSCATLKAWNTIVCCYLQASHHYRAGCRPSTVASAILWRLVAKGVLLLRRVIPWTTIWRPWCHSTPLCLFHLLVLSKQSVGGFRMSCCGCPSRNI